MALAERGRRHLAWAARLTGRILAREISKWTTWPCTRLKDRKRRRSPLRDRSRKKIRRARWNSRPDLRSKPEPAVLGKWKDKSPRWREVLLLFLLQTLLKRRSLSRRLRWLVLLLDLAESLMRV